MMDGGRRGLFSLLKQDLILAWRNGLVLAAAVLSVIFILLVNFAIPKEAKLTSKEYVVDLTEDRIVAAYLTRLGASATLLDSEDELEQAMVRDRTAVGIVFQGTFEDPSVVVYSQGNEPEGAIKALDATIASLWNEATGVDLAGHHRVSLLRPQTAKPAFNKSMVPVILATEVTMLGYFFVAVMVFQEKAEGSIRAYRVSPGGTWLYITAKILSNTILAVAYGGVILAFTVGLGKNTLGALALVAAGGMVMTAAGLSLSPFFPDLSGFLYPAILVFMLFGMPVTAYFFPSLQIPILEFIPSYPLAFGIREVLFPTAKAGFFGPMMTTLAVESVAFILLARWSVYHNLMKEGR